MFRAVSQRIIRYNPFENAKYEKTEQKIRFLQKNDVAKLMALKVNDKEMEQARLMFVFACFTGLAVTDMEHLQYGHIQTVADGQKYIRKERQKTRVEFVVPLHPIAEVIIEHCKAEQERKGGMQSVKEKGKTKTMTDKLVFPCYCSRSVMTAKLSIVGRACALESGCPVRPPSFSFGRYSNRNASAYQPEVKGKTNLVFIPDNELCTACHIVSTLTKVDVKTTRKQTKALQETDITNPDFPHEIKISRKLITK